MNIPEGYRCCGRCTLKPLSAFSKKKNGDYFTRCDKCRKTERERKKGKRLMDPVRRFVTMPPP